MMKLASGHHVRCAIDMGSGSTKLLVCSLSKLNPMTSQTIDTSENTKNKVKLDTILHQEERELLLSHDYEKNGRLSDEIFEKCVGVLNDYKKIVQSHNVNGEVKGIGTQIFRVAPNGIEFLKKIKLATDVDIRIVSQEEEGRIGFATAKTLGVSAGGDVSQEEGENIIGWDSGGGSFQISRNYGNEIIKGPLGSSVVTAALVRLQGKDFAETQTPNPVHLGDVKNLKSFILEILEEKVDKASFGGNLREHPVIAIGGETCSFNCCKIAVFGNNDAKSNVIVRRQEIGLAIEKLLNQTDEDLVNKFGYTKALQPEMVLPKIVLIHTVMEHFDIPEFRYFHSVGSCLGAVVLEEQQLQQQKD